MDKIRFVQRVPIGGRVYLYFRKGDYREGPLDSPDGSEELRQEVQAILDRLAGVSEVQKPRAGNVGGMLKAYNRSADFLGLARSTQAAYQDVIDELNEDCGDVPLSDVTRPWIAELRDAWALRGHRVANVRLSVLANALEAAIEDGRIEADPFARLKRAKTPRDRGEAHPAWDDFEVEEGIEEAIRRGRHGLARAIALGRFGGFRRGTICKIPLAARTKSHDPVVGPHTRLRWVTEKRRVLCDKREDARLAEVIRRTSNGQRTLTIAFNADGAPWKERQLNQAVDRLMDALAKAGKVRAATKADGTVYCPLTIHGLRHARGVELAEAGASDAEIMSQLEHATDRQAKIYRRQADRKKLADAGQDRVDNVVTLKSAQRQSNVAGT